MDYRRKAGALAFRASCAVCEAEFVMDEPVWVDEDGGGGDAGDRLRLTVRHHQCHLSLEVERQETMLHAANLAFVAGSPEAAALIITEMRNRSLALTRSMETAA